VAQAAFCGGLATSKRQARHVSLWPKQDARTVVATREVWGVRGVSGVGTSETKPPQEPAAALDERTSFSLLILQRVDRVEDEIRDLRQEMRQEIGEVRGEIGQVRQEIGQVRQQLLGEIGQVRQELAGLARWSFGTIIAVLVGAGAVVVTLVANHR